jgi:hypothetical protein
LSSSVPTRAAGICFAACDSAAVEATAVPAVVPRSGSAKMDQVRACRRYVLERAAGGEHRAPSPSALSAADCSWIGCMIWTSASIEPNLLHALKRHKCTRAGKVMSSHHRSPPHHHSQPHHHSPPPLMGVFLIFTIGVGGFQPKRL